MSSQKKKLAKEEKGKSKKKEKLAPGTTSKVPNTASAVPVITEQTTFVPKKSKPQKAVGGALSSILAKTGAAGLQAALQCLAAKWCPDQQRDSAGIPGSDGTYTQMWSDETRIGGSFADGGDGYKYAVFQWCPVMAGNMTYSNATTFATYPRMIVASPDLFTALGTSLFQYKPVAGGIMVEDFDPITAVQGEIFQGWTNVFLIPPSYTSGDPSQLSVAQLTAARSDVSWNPLSDITVRNTLLPWKIDESEREGEDYFLRTTNQANVDPANQTGDMPTIIIRVPTAVAQPTIRMRFLSTWQCKMALPSALMGAGNVVQLKPSPEQFFQLEEALLEAIEYVGGHMEMPMLQKAQKTVMGWLLKAGKAVVPALWKAGVGAAKSLFSDIAPRLLAEHHLQAIDRPTEPTDLEVALALHCPVRKLRRCSFSDAQLRDADVVLCRQRDWIKGAVEDRFRRMSGAPPQGGAGTIVEPDSPVVVHRGGPTLARK